MQETPSFTPNLRPMNDSLFPPFAKGAGMGSRNNIPRDAKKDSRNMTPSGKNEVYKYFHIIYYNNLFIYYYQSGRLW